MRATDRPLWRGRTNVSQLVICQIEHAERLRTGKTKGKKFVVTQGSFQGTGGDVNSAGTHAKDGVVDLRWEDEPGDILALRQAGILSWHRTPEQGPWPDHIHGVSLIVPRTRIADAAVRQIISWENGGNGLASNGRDDGPQFDISFVWPVPKPTPNITAALNARTTAKRVEALKKVQQTGSKTAQAAATKYITALAERDQAKAKIDAARATLKKIEVKN